LSKLVECVPNISDGQKQEVIQAVLDAMVAVPGVTLLDHESDKDHNRSVLTIIGEPDAILNGAFACIKKASELIDLTKHKGEHPRMGATDVCPFIPIKDVTMEECVELAKNLGEKVAKELKIPVFLYEEAATIPERQNLANVRRGQFEGIREEIKTNPDKKPDFGLSEVHPTAGVIAIGARMILVAYNVNMDSADVSYARTIGKAIRFKDGGFKYTKAMGFEIAERKISQVSMNMVNYLGTPLFRTFEFVKSESARFGIPVIGSEIVGLVPLKALSDAVAFEFRTEITEEMVDWNLDKNQMELSLAVTKFNETLGKSVSKALSESTGGFKGVQARIDNEKIVISISDIKITPMHRIFYTALTEIERFGATITKMSFQSIPLHTLVAAAEFYLRIENFHIDQILEVKLKEKVNK
jgi:glutamate formiminotransferase